MAGTGTTDHTWGLRYLAAAFGLAAVSILGAWVFELGFGYLPCKLCLQQRWPYYLGLPLLAITLYLAWTAADRRLVVGLGLLSAAVFLAGAGLGVYHAGVEWKFWAGPTDCGGKIAVLPGSIADFRKALANAKVIRCDEAAVRVLGLSFAGWNVLVSLAVAGLTLRGSDRASR